jgi:hypothetical protein
MVEAEDTLVMLAQGQAQQAQPKPRPKSGFYGVSANRNKSKAQLYYDGKTHSLGTFHTREEAAAVYDKAAQKHRGSAALCNFATAAEGEAASVAAVGEWERQQPAQPAAQPKPRPKSVFYGVSANHNKWQAQLCYDGKTHSLGVFNTREEAAVVYDKAVREHRGSAAVCNFVTAAEGEAAAEAAVGESERQQAAQLVQPKPRPKSGFYGVYASGSKWRAYLRYGGKSTTSAHSTRKRKQRPYMIRQRESTGAVQRC